MSKFFRPKFRPRRSRKSSRPGEKLYSSLLRSRPRTNARVRLYSLQRPIGLAALRRPATIKARREVPTDQGRDEVFQVNRTPLLPYRYKTDYFGADTLKELFTEDRAAIRDQLRHISTPGSICQQRRDRRSVLFMNKIAGKGKHKSPGAGGTYRRTPESEGSCHKR